MTKKLALLTALSLSLLGFGCQTPRSTVTTSSGELTSIQSRPKVAVVPLINSTENPVSWDLSEELTQELRRSLELKESLSLLPHGQVCALTERFAQSHNPFSTQSGWMKAALPGSDFAVFLELIEHQEIPHLPPGYTEHPERCSAQFDMSVRVRVMDLRATSPRIVLQEILHSSDPIPQPFNQYHFHQVSWDDPAFSITPVGLAHSSMIREIASRVEAYILLNGSSEY